MKKKVWVIIGILILALIGYGLYNYAYNAGYDAGHRFAEANSKESMYKNMTESLTDQVSTYESYLKYFLDAAVFVTEYGERYHRFQCHYIQDSNRIWIYNPENAKVKGYSPCSYCFSMSSSEYLFEKFN